MPPLQTKPQDGRCGCRLRRKISAGGCGGFIANRTAGRKRGMEAETPPQARSQHCFCGQGLVRRRERERNGDLPSLFTRTSVSKLLWARPQGGEKGEPGLPPQMRPQYGSRYCLRLVGVAA